MVEHSLGKGEVESSILSRSTSVLRSSIKNLEFSVASACADCCGNVLWYGGNSVENAGWTRGTCVLVFVQLLKTDAYRSGKLGLRDIRMDANRCDLSTDMLVSGVWIAFSFRSCPRLEKAGRFASNFAF